MSPIPGRRGDGSAPPPPHLAREPVRRAGVPLPLRTVPLVLSGLLLLAVALPRSASAQTIAPRTESADLPLAGEVRLEVSPVFQNWSETFTEGGGGSVELADRFSGPLLDNLFPGREALVSDLNADANALGFDPIAPEEAAFAELDVRELNVDVRTIPVRLELGIFDWLSLDGMLTVVQTEAEPFLSIESPAATLGPAAAIVEAPDSFLSGVSTARADLQGLLGTLGPEERAAATELLERSGAFADALDGRVSANRLLPLPGTPAGEAWLQRWAELMASFGDFGVGAPMLEVSGEVTPQAVRGFLTGPAVAGAPLDARSVGFSLGEGEIGARVKILDSFTALPDPDRQTGRDPGTGPGGDGAEGEDGTGSRPGAELEEGGAGGWIQLRTSVGVRARIPGGDGDTSPFGFRGGDFFAVPGGDGQTDLEGSVYQDLRGGRRLRATVVLRYGVQLSDDVVRRIGPPDRPFPLPSQRAVLERDLGNYFIARLAPRFRLNPLLSLGTEYRLWHKGSDTFRVVDGDGDASPLEVGTEQTRHRVGIGAVLRTRPEGPGADGVKVRFVHQLEVAGSGLTTPAASLTTVSFQAPFGIF